MPIALISLLDGQRQWFKSKVGLTATETAQNVSFCAQALGLSELFIVGDAAQDARFAGNPMVTSEPGVVGGGVSSAAGSDPENRIRPCKNRIGAFTLSAFDGTLLIGGSFPKPAKKASALFYCENHGTFCSTLVGFTAWAGPYDYQKK